MTQTVQPSRIMTVLAELAECLCNQIEEDGSPVPCFCGVLPGSSVPMDVGSCDNGCGMAYTRLVSAYPSNEVGVLNLQPSNCGNGTGIDVEIGIFRCYPIEDDGGSPPPDDMLDAVILQMNDVETMRRTLACCTWLPNADFLVGQYSALGPGGGVLGGVFPISAWMP